MLTFSKTSHGPQKSMTTAPLEIRNATGMLPSAGGGSGLGSTAAAAPGTPGVGAEFALIATKLTAASGIAAGPLAAMPIIGQFLPRTRRPLHPRLKARARREQSAR